MRMPRSSKMSYSREAGFQKSFDAFDGKRFVLGVNCHSRQAESPVPDGGSWM
jgi:hypothetical protein